MFSVNITNIYLYTHSITSRPSSMRFGDSRRPLQYLSFLFHCARSCDISYSWMYSQPVHSSMSCIHCLLGLPWFRSPSMIPSRTVSANCPALPRVMWPQCIHVYTVSRKKWPPKESKVTLVILNRNHRKLQRTHWHPFEHCVQVSSVSGS